MKNEVGLGVVEQALDVIGDGQVVVPPTGHERVVSFRLQPFNKVGSSEATPTVIEDAHGQPA